jgi:hypothetical protein
VSKGPYLVCPGLSNTAVLLSSAFCVMRYKLRKKKLNKKDNMEVRAAPVGVTVGAVLIFQVWLPPSRDRS